VQTNWYAGDESGKKPKHAAIIPMIYIVCVWICVTVNVDNLGDVVVMTGQCQ